MLTETLVKLIDITSISSSSIALEICIRICGKTQYAVYTILVFSPMTQRLCNSRLPRGRSDTKSALRLPQWPLRYFDMDRKVAEYVNNMIQVQRFVVQQSWRWQIVLETEPGALLIVRSSRHIMAGSPDRCFRGSSET